MRSWRDRRGQTGAEYLGGLLLVAVVIAALVTTGVADAAAGNVRRLVCEIAGGDCEPADPPTAEETPPPDEGPIEGPAPIPAGPLVVLPFPGSVSVRCTVARRSEEACKGAPGSGVSVQTTGEVKVERSETRLNGKGCPQQVLSVSTTLKLESTGTADGKVAKGTLSNHLGQSSTYAVTVAPDQADAIEHGERQPPNAVDPRTILPGERVQLTEEFYAGHSLSASYRALQAQLGYDEGHRVSSGVIRVDDSTVRVYVGDEDFVRDALALGLGAGGAKVSLGTARELAEGKLHAVDIDISSQAGWNAYQQFVTSGTLPESGTPGTANPTRSTTTRYTGSTALEAELGPIAVGGILNDEFIYVTETTRPDGSVEWAGVGRVNDTGVEITTRRDADGNPIGEPTYAFNLEGVSEHAWEAFQTFTGGSTPLPPDGHVRMEFTPGDLEALRQQARDTIASYLQEEEGLTDDEVADLEVTRDGTVRIPGLNPIPLPSGLSQAGLFASDERSPEEMLLQLWRRGWGSADEFIGELSQYAESVSLAEGDWTGIPGTVRSPDCG